MKKPLKDEKKMLSMKLLEFKKGGLLSYADYLKAQKEELEKGEHKKSYKKFIEKEIESTNKKIEKIESKLKD